MESQLEATRIFLILVSKRFLDYFKHSKQETFKYSPVFFGVELPFVIESGKYILHKHYLGSK